MDELLRRIRLGLIPSRADNGFTFVDVAPHSPRLGQSPDRRPTYVELTAEELAALHPPFPAPMPAHDRASVVPVGGGEGSEREWMRVRRKVSANRRRG